MKAMTSAFKRFFGKVKKINKKEVGEGEDFQPPLLALFLLYQAGNNFRKRCNKKNFDHQRNQNCRPGHTINIFYDVEKYNKFGKSCYCGGKIPFFYSEMAKRLLDKQMGKQIKGKK